MSCITGRMGDQGAPWWLGILLVVLAAVALVPARTRIPVLVCWIVAFVAALLAAGLALLSFKLPAVDTAAGLGFLVVALQAAFLVAAVLGAHGLVGRGLPRGHLRRPVALLVAAVAIVVPAAGLAWFVIGGHGLLQDHPDNGIPAYMVQSAELGPAHGILVVRGDVETGLTYSVLRDDGITLGEDEVAALSAEDPALDDAVAALVSGPDPEVADALADLGIEYVVLPSPADGDVASVIDSTAGLSQASAEDPATRAWQVGPEQNPDAVDGPDSWLRTGLLVLQVLGILVVAVLCAPTSRRRAS